MFANLAIEALPFQLPSAYGWHSSSLPPACYNSRRAKTFGWGFTVKLSAIYGAAKPAISFELFPPKTDAGMESLFADLGGLVDCGPAYITCTYGAGGSTRGKTLEVLGRIRAAYPGIPLASHLTCVGATRDDIRAYVREAQAQGVDYLVALRGDPPKGETTFTATAGGLAYANELVAMLRAEFPGFGLLVGGYPEKHPEAVSLDADLDALKRKVDAGADAVIAQLFYDNADFYRWRDRCVAAGIGVPIVPGLLPVITLAQVQRITGLCGARLPEGLAARLQAAQASEEAQTAVGTEHAAAQAQDLLRNGVPGIHFYVLNKSKAAMEICAGL